MKPKVIIFLLCLSIGLAISSCTKEEDYFPRRYIPPFSMMVSTEIEPYAGIGAMMQTGREKGYLIIYRPSYGRFQVYDRRCGYCPNHDTMVAINESGTHAECPTCHTSYTFYPDEYLGCNPSRGLPLLRVPCRLENTDRLMIGEGLF